MQLHSLADLVGANAKVQFSTQSGLRARWIKVCALSGNARVGDFATVGAAQGVLAVQNVPVEFHTSEADPTDYIDLTVAGAYVPSGTTLTVTYGV